MAVEFTKECDVGQGYNFKQDEHHTFGYITSWSIGDNDISPDIKIVDPNSLGAVSASAGTTGAGGMDTSGIFNKAVVGVLTSASWSTLPNENITLNARVSLSNAQTLQMLTMQSLKKVIMQIGFVIYEYDLVNQKYYTSFATKEGAAINSSVKPTAAGKTGFSTTDATAVFALLGKTSGTEFGIKIGAKAEEDPLGIRNHTLELALAPPIASSPQKMLIQTSDTIKLIQPWGLPQK